MLNDTIKQLQQHKKEVLTQVEELNRAANMLGEAIALMSKGEIGRSGKISLAMAAGAKVSSRKPKFSEAGLERIRQAQIARWAKFNKGKTTDAKPAAKKKVKLSAAGRAAIIAAQKARWAKYNAGKA